jgi:hypothetical protein
MCDLVPDPVTAASTIITEVAEEAHHAASLRRRVNRALLDLGLDEVLPPGFVTIGAEGLAFQSLSAHQSDRLVHALEELVGRVPAPPVPLPYDGQPALWS